jgi:hypothetical protein
MFVKCACQNCNETISFEDGIAGVSISCPCCAAATTLIAPPRRKRKSIFDENDLTYRKEFIAITKEQSK